MQELRTMGSMAEMLMRYVSTSTIRDSNYEIALLLLRNYSRVRHMTQKQMAELCFVSEASISRFCRFLGFESFHDFKAQMDQDFSVKDDYSRRLQNLMKQHPSEAVSLWKEELVQSVNDTVNEQLLTDAKHVAGMIHEAKRTAVFSHHFLWDAGRFIQSKLMMMGKFIAVHQDYEMQKSDASQMEEKDLAIIMTVGGSWYTRYNEIYDVILKSGCQIVAVTQNLSSPYLNRMDYVMKCGNSNMDDTGKYCMLMASDAIVLNYLKEYGDENEEI